MVVARPEEVFLGWGFPSHPSRRPQVWEGMRNPGRLVCSRLPPGTLLPGGLTLGPAHFLAERLSQRQD